MPDVGVIASIGRKGNFTDGHHFSGAGYFFCRRGEIETDVHNQSGLGECFAIAGLESITMGITPRGNQAGDSRRRPCQSAGEVAEGAIHSDDREGSGEHRRGTSPQRDCGGQPSESEPSRSRHELTNENDYQFSQTSALQQPPNDRMMK